jgi:hypothetical protein
VVLAALEKVVAGATIQGVTATVAADDVAMVDQGIVASVQDLSGAGALDRDYLGRSGDLDGRIDLRTVTYSH